MEHNPADPTATAATTSLKRSEPDSGREDYLPAAKRHDGGASTLDSSSSSPSTPPAATANAPPPDAHFRLPPPVPTLATPYQPYPHMPQQQQQQQQQRGPWRSGPPQHHHHHHHNDDGGSGASALVLPNLELAPSVAKGPLAHHVMKAIQQQAIESLSRHDPLLRHMMEIKVVCNPRRNFINVTVKREYVTLCHKEVFDDVRYCFFVSDKLEPFVIITAVHPLHGRLMRLTRQQAEHLAHAIDLFKRRFGIGNETYHYTPLQERRETDDFVHGGGATVHTKSHSSHFHLKVRIATEMYIARLPVCTLFDLAALKRDVEPVRYNYSRECKPWSETYPLILQDTVESM